MLLHPLHVLNLHLPTVPVGVLKQLLLQLKHGTDDAYVYCEGIEYRAVTNTNAAYHHNEDVLESIEFFDLDHTPSGNGAGTFSKTFKTGQNGSSLHLVLNAITTL